MFQKYVKEVILLNYKTKEDVQKRVQEHYDQAIGAGYEVVNIFCS